MDQNQPELTLEESIKQVMQTLPPAIRDYLARGGYTTVAKSLMTKYALRIDQGGVLEREIMLLLMGIETPEEFTKALATDASLNQQTINGIVQDVNTQIFIPLREEMMRGAAQPTKPVVPPSRPAVAPNVAGAGESKFFHLENKIPPPSPKAMEGTAPRPAVVSGEGGPRPAQQPVTSAPLVFAAQPTIQPAAPTPARVGTPTESVGVVARPATLAEAIGNALNAKPKVVQQQPRSPFSNIAPLPPKFISPRPSVAPSVGGPTKQGSQTSLPPHPVDSSKLLEDHEEPHIEFGKTSVQPSPAPEVRPSSVIPKVAPKMQPILPKVESQVPSNLPGAMPPFPVPDAQPAAPVVAEVHALPIEPPRTSVASGVGGRPVPPAPVAPVAPIKSYTTDPYREPIE